MRDKKGITLIALIITIIVMLILVGVTINYSLNGGLITKAKDAADQTQIEADKESLLMAALGCMGTNGNIVFTGAEGLDNNLPAGFSGTNGTYTKGGYTYAVNAETGEITVTKSGGDTPTPLPQGNLTDVEKYILGEEGTGRSLWDIMNHEMAFQDDTTLTPGINEATAVTMVNFMESEPGIAYFYINYNNDGNLYRFKATYDTTASSQSEAMASYRTEPVDTNTKIVTIAVTDETVGTEVEMDGVDYIVLYGEGEKTAGAQLITKYAMQDNGNDITLGYNDPVAVSASLTPFTQNKTKDDVEPYMNLEKAVYSYNNAVKTLNDKCYGLLMNANISSKVAGIRSVGSSASTINNPTSNPTTPVTTPINPYTSDNLNGTWPTSDEHYNAKVGNGIGESTDENFLEDFDRLVYLEKTAATLEGGSSEAYWLASRVVYEGSSNVYFGVRSVRSDGSCYDSNLWDVDTDDVDSNSNGKTVRPVVSLNSGVLADYLD